MKRYDAVIEHAEGNYSAYVPDLPGCVAVGDTLAEVETMIREASEFHLEGMQLMVNQFPSCPVYANTSKILDVA